MFADRVIAAVFAAALVAELVYVVDVATHGAVSRAVEPFIVEARRRAMVAAEQVRRERDVQRWSRWVVFEAIEATREGAPQ